MSQNGPPRRPDAGHKAWGAFGYLVAGVGFYGGLGWLLDRYLGTSFLLPVGLLVGLGLSLYLVLKRYGYHEPKDNP